MKNPFKNIKTVNRKSLIDDAFRQASKAADKVKFEDRNIEIAKQKEGVRIKIAGNFINSQIKQCVNSFPETSKISKVHYELADALIGIDNLKKALAQLNYTTTRIRNLQMKSFPMLKNSRTTFECRRVRKEFYGKILYFLKSNKKSLDLIYDSFALKDLPDFREIPTIIISGLPNVGKTSLLKCLTGSEPEIKPYPFTTKGLMLGYTKNFQFVDTPGLLDRKLDMRNKIEKQSLIALENLANLVIYMFDISETCGYPLEKQKGLLEEIKNSIKKPLIIVANKYDVYGRRTLEELGVEDIIPISCETKFNIEKLKQEISKKLAI